MPIAFVGCGNMGMAILKAMLANGFNPREIVVFETNPSIISDLSTLGINCLSATKKADFEMVVLAVKPQIYKQVANDYSSQIRTSLVLSIMAGVRCASLKGDWLHSKVVRAMPNLAAAYGKSSTGVFTQDYLQPEHIQIINKLMGAIGTTYWFDSEEMIDKLTAISGSAPAYFYLLAQHLISSAKKLGFKDADANKIVEDTLLGAAEFMQKTGLSVLNARLAVTSKGGTTEAALQQFEVDGLENIVYNAVQAAFKKSQNLGG